MTESEKQIKYGNRWGYLVKGFIMTMFLGILYAWSIFIAPLEEAFGWVRTETTITYSIMMVTFALGQLTAGFWSRMLKSQSRALTLFSFLLALGILLDLVYRIAAVAVLLVRRILRLHAGRREQLHHLGGPQVVPG